jgi:hypothetical protein
MEQIRFTKLRKKQSIFCSFFIVVSVVVVVFLFNLYEIYILKNEMKWFID